jgi:hypothetical protein
VIVSHLLNIALVTSIVRSLGMFPTLGTIGVRILFVVAAWAVGMLIYVTIERPLTRRLIPHPAARSLAAVAAKSS